jgi:DHA2 family multidrug resistance protein-like MFS transporter
MASATVNLFRQLGAMLGPAVLGTIVTSRFPTLLTGSLAAHGVPDDRARAIATGISHGRPATADAATLGLLPRAVPEAFTTALHGGLLTGGLVLLAVAVPAALFVRHRHPAPVPSIPVTVPVLERTVS